MNDFSKLTKDQLKELGMSGIRNPKKYQGIVKEGEEKKRKHEEADLHLLFCKWVKLQYPNDQFVRHEREGKRSFYMQNLFKVYNSDLDKMPDFELLEPSGLTHVAMPKGSHCGYYYHNDKPATYTYYRLYIEFKRPGTTLTLRDGITIKPEYKEQYKRHVRFWEQNSPAYFCSDFDEACKLYRAYKEGKPLPMQVFRMEDNSPYTFFK